MKNINAGLISLCIVLFMSITLDYLFKKPFSIHEEIIFIAILFFGLKQLDKEKVKEKENE